MVADPFGRRCRNDPAHEDETPREEIEAVAPRHTRTPRPLVELLIVRAAIERILVDLEQLVARVILQHIHQGLAGMPIRIEGPHA